MGLHRRLLLSLAAALTLSCTLPSSLLDELFDDLREQPVSPNVIGALPTVCEARTVVDLMANSGVVGTLEVANDEANLYVVYRTAVGSQMESTALFIGNSEQDIPRGTGGSTRVMDFPYKSSHPTLPNTVVWEIPLSVISGQAGVISAIAVVGEVPERAWAAGVEISPLDGSMYFPYDVAACAAETMDGSGGAVATRDGAAGISIPAGALNSSTDITIVPTTIDDIRAYALGANPTAGDIVASSAPAALPSTTAPGAGIVEPNGPGAAGRVGPYAPDDGEGSFPALFDALEPILGVTPVAQTGWDFGPDGLEFLQPVTVTLRYSDADIPEGFDETLLSVFLINGIYEKAPSTVDPVLNLVTAQVDHFSFYFLGWGILQPVADLSAVSLIASADSIEVGETVSYTATVGNFGPSDVTDAFVTYSGFGDMVSGPLDPGCTETMPPFIATVEIVCEVGTVPNSTSMGAPSVSFVPQTTGEFEIWASPSSAESDDPDMTNNRATALVTVGGRVADLQFQTYFDTPDPAPVGADIVYSLLFLNDPGSAQAVDGAVLVLNPLGDATFVSATEEACFETPLGVTCPLPPLLPGLIQQIDVTLRPNAGVGTITVTAQLNVPLGTVDPDDSNNLVVQTTTIGTASSADLGVVSSGESADFVELGQPVTYQATLQNFGPDGVTDAVVYYQAFGNVVAGTIDRACTQTTTPAIADVEIVCTIGSLAASELAVAPPVSFVAQSTGAFTVWIDPGSSANDANVGNNRFEDSFTVTGPQADLRVDRIVDDRDPVQAGGDVRYDIDVIATAAALPVEGAVLRLLFTGDADLQSSTSSCSVISGGVACPLSALTPGLVNTISVTMRLPTAGQVVSVEATVVVPASIADPDLTNNTQTETTVVQAAGPASISVGQLIAGTIEVSNDVDVYQFSGTAGQTVRLHASLFTATQFTAVLSITDLAGSTEYYPDGQLGNRADDDSSVSALVTLPSTGDYAIRVEGIGTGDYRVGLGTDVGRLDTTFGTNGIVRGPRSSLSLNPFLRMDLVGDEIVTIGDATLSRFDASGAPATGFGTGGAVDLEAALGLSVNWGAVRVQPDGRIVTGGRSWTFPYSWIVARFGTDGTLDTTFSGDGWTQIDLGGDRTSAAVQAIRFLQDGPDLDIVVAGNAGYQQGRLGIVRLNPDGSFDTAFGSGGIVTDAIGATPQNMDIQSDGRIVIHGGLTNPTLARYTTAGALDTSFGTGGVVTAGVAGTFRDMSILPDDDIMLLGEGSGNAIAMRLTPGGSLDGTFGSGGVAAYDLGVADQLRAVVQDASGNLVMVGRHRTIGGTFVEFLIVRTSGNGVLDATFGVGGFLLERRSDEARAVALDTQGRIVIGGQEIGSLRGIHLTRHLPN
jgi:uncharacterized delta-60 repeat protein